MVKKYVKRPFNYVVSSYILGKDVFENKWLNFFCFVSARFLARDVEISHFALSFFPLQEDFL